MKKTIAFLAGFSFYLLIFVFIFREARSARAPDGVEVTWYQDGEYTATSDIFNPASFTCAVRNEVEMNHWIRFEYHGNVVYCWANDLMPPDSKAEYDLTPAAFARLGRLRVGRLKDVKVRIIE